MKITSIKFISTFALACLLAGLLSGCTTSGPVTTTAPVTDEPKVVVPEEPAPTEEVAETVVPVIVAPAYKREDVLWIQQRLQELGYYKGDVDGAVGAATRTAVKAYQRDQYIQDDGRPTAELREFMWRNGG